MKKLIYLLFATVIMFAISCNQKSKQSEKQSQKVYEVGGENGNLQTACYHASKIYWKGTKPGGEHTGIIKLKEGGNFLLDDGKLVGGEFIIDMNSIANIDIENEGMKEKLVGHLKSPDFFHVDSFPEGKFVISGLEPIESDEFNMQVSGNLTLKGISKGISFKAKVNVDENAVKVKSEEFKLDRTEWGVNYKSKSVFKEIKDKFIDDEFSVTIEANSM